MEAFNYELPPELIAQRPIQPHEAAALLVVDRAGSTERSTFENIAGYLRPTDLLIFNDSKVIPARLFGRRGTLDIEVVLLEPLTGSWRCIARPLRRLKANDSLHFSGGLSAVVNGKAGDGTCELTFYRCGSSATREDIFGSGVMPIPPYIREGRADARDSEDYQTHFAKVEGSIAAPTASLHFTPRLMDTIRHKGCAFSFLTLHVGRSSIREIVPGQRPESEKMAVKPEVLETVAETKRRGGRVIAVGTTVVRALEAAALGQTGEADLFITPGFDFKVVDGIVTNFHFPGSTHLLLVEAFLKNRHLLEEVYQLAINSRLRFLSYGDGMLIV